MRLSIGATEYVRVPWHVAEDPTADDVSIAIIDQYARPTEDDWLAAAWEPDQTASPWYCRVLIGPDGETTLPAVGTFAVWSTVTDNPEIPERLAGVVYAI